MNKYLKCILLGGLFATVGQGGSSPTAFTYRPAGAVAYGNQYTSISAATAKRMMDVCPGFIVVDVRTPQEFIRGHIPGAILVPNQKIKTQTIEELPDKDGGILVYCRSGSRSHQAAATLAAMGYSQVYDFGGIQSWPYEIERSN